MERLGGSREAGYPGERFNDYTENVLLGWEVLERMGANKYVFVDEGRLRDMAVRHYDDDFETPDWRIPGIYPEDDQSFAVTTIADSVFNASFNLPGGGKWQIENRARPDKPYRGADALHRSFYVAFNGKQDILADDLAPFLADEESMNELLPGVPDPDMRLRVGRDFVQGLRDHYSGSTLNVLRRATDNNPVTGRPELRAFNGGHGLVDLLSDESVFGSAFADTQVISSFKFPFAKRAQLAAMVYHGRARTSPSLPRLADVQDLGPVADYQVPRPLRFEDAMIYNDELDEKVANWEPLEPNSRMEVEIRAATVKSIAFLLRNINQLRTDKGKEPINMSHLDFMFWMLGRSLRNGPNPHYVVTPKY